LSPSASTRDVSITDLDYLRRAWQRVKATHTNEIIDVIRNGAALVEDELEIKRGLPSLEALCDVFPDSQCLSDVNRYRRYRDQLPKAWRSSLLKPNGLSLPAHGSPNGNLTEKKASTRSRSDSEIEAPISEALTKCFSLIESLRWAFPGVFRHLQRLMPWQLFYGRAVRAVRTRQ
jgi:hypothetical protein